MQNNLRNRSVALASTFALVLTGLVATAPAANASAPLTLKPTVGTNLGAFITDFNGAGVDIAVRIYIDRVLIDTINLTTK